MRIQDFELTIEPGYETDGGYVQMEHDTPYSIVMRNASRRRCDADVRVDGKPIGTFRIGDYRRVRLDRPADDDGRFTFYRADSKKGKKAGLEKVSSSEMGLVQVRFMPEREREVFTPRSKGWEARGWEARDWEDGVLRSMSCSQPISSSSPMYGASAGGTGLSGHSNQKFYDVAALDYDENREVVISLRLVEVKNPRKTKGVRKLKPVSANTVPSPV